MGKKKHSALKIVCVFALWFTLIKIIRNICLSEFKNLPEITVTL